MKRNTLILMIVAGILPIACNKEQVSEPATQINEAKLMISLTSKMTRAEFQTSDEAKVSDIKAFVFNGNSLDAYSSASSSEISSKVMELSCTQGTRDVWVVVNGPSSLSSITTKSGLKKAVSNMTADNTGSNFVMVGKLENQNVTATFSATVTVDRIVSRVRLFQICRSMSNSALAALDKSDFKIIRAYVTNVTDNACYDVFTPSHPDTYTWKSAMWQSSGAIETGNSFIYNKLTTAGTVADQEKYGTAYTDETTAATFTFYVYPNEYSSVSTSSPADHDQCKLVVECQIDGEYYTYPIPLGAVGYNKSYDVKLLTITRLGNNSDGDDKIEDKEDEVILPSTATFTITVNDWTQQLTFGGVSNGEITI